MERHIQFMQSFLAGLKSMPNPDKYAQAYIRAFEVCLESAKRQQKFNKEVYAEYVELPTTL